MGAADEDDADDKEYIKEVWSWDESTYCCDEHQQCRHTNYGHIHHPVLEKQIKGFEGLKSLLPVCD